MMNRASVVGCGCEGIAEFVDTSFMPSHTRLFSQPQTAVVLIAVAPKDVL